MNDFKSGCESLIFSVYCIIYSFGFQKQIIIEGLHDAHT